MNATEHDDKTLREWLTSLKVLHRGNWDAARWYESFNIGLGVATATFAAISGTTAFPALIGGRSADWAGVLGLLAAMIAAWQTALRPSELSVKHKHAAIQFGQLRRELEEDLMLGLTSQPTDQQEKSLTGFRKRWAAVDDESLPIPQRFIDGAKQSIQNQG